MDVAISSQFTSNFQHTIAFPETDEQKWLNSTFRSFLMKWNEKISVDLLQMLDWIFHFIEYPTVSRTFYPQAPFGFQKQWWILSSLLT